MMKLKAAIKSIFANEVEVRVSRERVTVSWNGQSKSIRPVVHVARDSGRVRIIGIGDAVGSAEPSLPVPLFGPLPPGVTLETWVESLNAFMAYALAQARLRIVAIRPIVRLRGARELGQLPSGDPEQVLTSAVLKAHAFHCTVDES